MTDGFPEREPSAADLAAIEKEWPRIAADLAALDREFAALTGAGGVDELAGRRARRAARRVLAVRPVPGVVAGVPWGGDAA
jgi:hypothetical protein